MVIKRINLIPEDLKEKSRIQFSHGAIAGASILVLVMAITGFLQLRALNQITRNQADLSSENVMLAEQIIQLQGEITGKGDREAQVKRVQQILDSRVVWNDIFRELTLLVPESTWLTSLVMTNTEGKRQINFIGETPQLKKVADFFTALEGSYHFHHTNIKYSERLDAITPAVYRFQMESSIPKQVSTKVGP